MIHSVQLPLLNRSTLTIETGKIGRQADGAVMVRYGDTIVFVCAVAQPLKESAGFLALTVEYREKIFAVGKIPGGFYKREGRSTVKEILTMRMIDRPLRPLFPDYYDSDEIQITALVLSADQEHDPDTCAMIGASAALMLSKNIPFTTPIGSVRVGLLDDQFILNPTYKELEKSKLNLVVAGTKTDITMVEGQAQELPEDTVVKAITWAHQSIRQIIALQEELVQKVGVTHVAAPPPPKELENLQNWIEKNFTQDLETGLSIALKKAREKYLEELFKKIQDVRNVLETSKPTEIAATNEHVRSLAYDEIQRKIVRRWLKQGKRIDGRGLREIRPIRCEVGLLPRTHGSALFTRGETQALVTATLGSSMDEQIIEGLAPEASKRFMLHYNFPPFSVGEVAPNRGPSRREIGHGELAERALEPILPEDSKFPYTIRIVSEIMESNGSSSMATVCGGTLALMDAGIPICKPVGGVAMGLIREDNQYCIFTDIIGAEDHLGDMDLKVAGTPRGITAMQMDVKISGISTEILIQALQEARVGRIHILREMMQALDHPKRELSPYAPRIVQFTINPEKIATIIGPGGKTIRSIQETTGTKIDIQNDGSVTIYCPQKQGAAAAKEMIEKLTEEVKIGKIYTGRVTAIKNFGAFVEILPGIEGLVHVSELENGYVQNVSNVVKTGDMVTVKVIAIDEQNRIKLSKRAAIERENRSEQSLEE